MLLIRLDSELGELGCLGDFLLGHVSTSQAFVILSNVTINIGWLVTVLLENIDLNID